MELVKQDLPPPGGFSSINYKRVPLKSPWLSPWKWAITFALMGVGWSLYHLDKKRINYEATEKKAATFSILPMLMAENDRARLRNFERFRKYESEIMKDVEGWKVGTYFGEPIYKTLEPNEWYEPYFLEGWIDTDMKDFDFACYLKVTH